MNSRYRYYHYQNVWIYISTSEPLINNLVLIDVKQFSIAIIAKDFNPEKYETLINIFSKTYLKTGDISKLLSYYLSVLINGSFISEENNLKFNCEDYDKLEIMASKLPIKSIIKMFGLDIILIYTALILKKRIAVYHHKLETLLQFIRTLPSFVWHRNDCYKILYPCVELSSSLELQELKSSNHYVAGFLESDIENRTDLYDIYVNLAAVEITVSHTSKDVFSMTKTHKDIAVFMTRQADINSNSDIDVIKEIMGKTNELIKTLKLMGDLVEGQEDKKKVITLEALKEKKLAPNLQNFLWNLSIAENLI